MGRASSSGWVGLALGLVVALAVAGAIALDDSSSSGAANVGALQQGGFKLLTIGQPARVQPIPSGFLGLSLEYTAIEPYAGTDARTVDPVLVQLIRNLTPGQAPVIRIGGDSTDSTWWPVSGMRRPGGVRYALTPGWLAVTRSITQALGARLIMGINLEANSQPVAAAEAHAFTTGIGLSSIDALEPGNEPELYGSWAWYRTPGGRRVTGRPSGYDFPAYTRDFSRMARALTGNQLAGPTTGAVKWMAHVNALLTAVPRLALVTLHRYPVQKCYIQPASPQYPTIPHLLAAGASRGLAASVAGQVAVAHARRVPLRIDEMNTNSCGTSHGVTDTFASALWALDALFAMANVGVDGVNIHTYPKAPYELFSFRHSHGQWQARVQPEYYGLLTFALAAPPGSRLLHLSGTVTNAVRAWATLAPDQHVRVALINDSPNRSQAIAIRAATNAPATLFRLQAPALASTHGITLAGQSFGTRTDSGLLAGPQRTPSIDPTAGDYLIHVPAASAAVLTLP
jgi:hypothetical protein